MRKLLILSALFIPIISVCQQLVSLNVDKIMRDPKWMGNFPGTPYWSEDGTTLFFNWNPENNPDDSLYSFKPGVSNAPVKVGLVDRVNLPSRFGSYNRARTKKIYQKDNSLILLDIPSKKKIVIIEGMGRVSNASFNHAETKVLFTMENNLISWEIATGTFKQLTDFRTGNERKETKTSDQDIWLGDDQLAWLRVLKERKENREKSREMNNLEEPVSPKTMYLGQSSIRNIQLSPDEKYITYMLSASANSKGTEVPTYVTESGYAEMLRARPKVGAEGSNVEMKIYDIAGDTTYKVNVETLPGIEDIPDYYSDYPKYKDKKPEKRKVLPGSLNWSPDGKYAFFEIRSQDNKDRWIGTLDVKTGKINVLDRQRDEAWIAGPGIGWSGFPGGNLGWMPDSKRIWFQSEESGYSHLYTIDITNNKKTALTKGNYEIYDPVISADKKSWYFEANVDHPGDVQVYKMPINGGKMEKLTNKPGRNDFYLSPDNSKIGISYSYSNQPTELYWMPAGANIMNQITNSQSEEYKSYPWRDPEIVTFKARDGAEVYARLYRPAIPQQNGPAVIFVHGAGYLQNAHKWWSSYFREYMFHNLLADNGYTVLDIDYRGSAGYGSNWRTGIYRHMGGKDLIDQVDGAKFLTEQYQVDANKIGIYGGSYGGFITLMAMFTEPGVFAAGAALRSVADWAHYNHPYTANILNTPVEDSLAYARSSPIYFAEGLEGKLLMCHGMVDTNVHFQDVVRLAQRLIELGKDDWELAVYPLENHGFVEPSSWTDEYTRIFKLFEDNLK
ncbi:MAG TPA: prolyl oligopeptidase family serine peptidase [Cyclobacteriaceae bacterium]